MFVPPVVDSSNAPSLISPTLTASLVSVPALRFAIPWPELKAPSAGQAFCYFDIALMSFTVWALYVIDTTRQPDRKRLSRKQVLVKLLIGGPGYAWASYFPLAVEDVRV